MYDIRSVQDFIKNNVLKTLYSRGHIVDFKIAHSKDVYYFVQLSCIDDRYIKSVCDLLRKQTAFSLVGTVGYKVNTISFLANVEMLKTQGNISSKKISNTFLEGIPDRAHVQKIVSPILEELGIGWYSADQEKGIILYEIREYNFFRVILYGFPEKDGGVFKRLVMTKMRTHFCVRNFVKENYFEIHF